MKTSSERILTTHVGSLPRPEALVEILDAQAQGRDYDPAALEAGAAEAVRDIVARQLASGVDIVSDGEMSKLSYTYYLRHRLSGIGPGDRPATGRTEGSGGDFQDMWDHPEFAQMLMNQRIMSVSRYAPPRCTGPVAYVDRAPLERDLANFRAALAGAEPEEAFLNAASPGVITYFIRDSHYGDEDAYVWALAEALKTEYEAIHEAGFLLQIDAPDLAMVRHGVYRDLSDAEFVKIAERNIEAINHATAEIPPEAMRLHVCWGNYAGPHTHDIEVGEIMDVLLRGRPQAVVFESANPRHDHEWEDWRAAAIPDDKVLIPGVIDSTTNFVEHPRLIAQRLCRYADIVGRERVIAGVDCGFSTVAGMPRVFPSIVWSKLETLAEGARLASERLWS